MEGWHKADQAWYVLGEHPILSLDGSIVLVLCQVMVSANVSTLTQAPYTRGLLYLERQLIIFRSFASPPAVLRGSGLIRFVTTFKNALHALHALQILAISAPCTSPTLPTPPPPPPPYFPSPFLVTYATTPLSTNPSTTSSFIPNTPINTSLVCSPSIGGGNRIPGVDSEYLTGVFTILISPTLGCWTLTTMFRARVWECERVVWTSLMGA